MFENLTNKFEEVFSSLKKAPSLDEKQVDEGLRGIRQALLEADVSLDVAKQFIENAVKNINNKFFIIFCSYIFSQNPKLSFLRIFHNYTYK